MAGAKRKLQGEQEYKPEKDAGNGSPKKPTARAKKAKVAAVDTSKPTGKPCRQWNQEENEKIKLGLLNYKNDYSKIKNFFFKDDPSVTTKDINNHIQNTPELKAIQNSNLVQVRNEKLDLFRKKLATEQLVITKSENNQMKPIIEISDVDRPKSIGGKEFVIPNESFLYFQPFMKAIPTHYIYFQRRYLTAKINVDYDEDKNHLIWEFIDQPDLLEEELCESNLIKKYPKIQEVQYSSPTRSFVSITVAPEDAMLETTKRYDHDTPNGALLEVWVERRIKRDKGSLKAPNTNLKIRTTTAHPLMPNQNQIPQINNNSQFSHFNPTIKLIDSSSLQNEVESRKKQNQELRKRELQMIILEMKKKWKIVS
jgi:hypothetical protein